MAQKVKSPRGELKWVFIDGEGREDQSGNMKYSACVVMTPEEAQPMIDAIDEFWEENKPRAAKKPKSLGFANEKVNEKETGNISFMFKTNVTYPDGKANVVDVYNAKAKKISLGGRKIGNGSEGYISGSMDVYTTDKTGKTAGVTLYLNAVQLTKFVEYEGNTGFEAEEDGFEGFEDSTSDFEEVPDTKNYEAEPEDDAKPRI